MAYSLVELQERRRGKIHRRRLRRALVAILVLAAAGASAGLLSAQDRGARRPVTPSPAAAAQVRGGLAADRRAPPTATVTIAATGDVAMGRSPVLPPDDGASFFADVGRALRGDVVLGNLETALTARGTSKCASGDDHCFAFRASPSYARRLRRAGFTVMSLANNHAYDFGAEGHADTVAALARARLGTTGRPGEITRERAGRVRVAVLGFAPYPWAQDLLDLEAARALVRRAARMADVVVVTMHAGAEGEGSGHVRRGPETYLGEQRGDPVAFAHAVVRAGADLVVGHGPHVLRGIEWYRGRLVAYSLGNFAGYHNFMVTGPLAVGAILRVTLHADGTWARGRLVSTRLVGPGTPELDPSNSAYGLVRRYSREDFGARAVRVTAAGFLRPPTR